MPQPQAQAQLQAGRARGNSNVAGFRPSARWQLESYCGICGAHFSYMRARHHCRHCGMSVCGRHSRQRAVVPTSLSALPQRVCDTCFPACSQAPRRPRGMTVGASGARSRSGSSARSAGRSTRGKQARPLTESTCTDGSASSTGSDALASPRIRSPRTLDHPRRAGAAPAGARKRAASSGDSLRSMQPIASPLLLPARSDRKKLGEMADNPSVCQTNTTASSFGTLSEVSDVVMPASRNKPLPFRRKAPRASRAARQSRDASLSIFSFASLSDSDSDSGSDIDDSDSEESEENSNRSAKEAAAGAAAAKADRADAAKKAEAAKRAKAEQEAATQAAAQQQARTRVVGPPVIDTANRKIVSIRNRTARPPSRKNELREKESLDFSASSSSIDFRASKIGNPADSEGAWDPAASTTSMTSMITRKYLPQPSEKKPRKSKARSADRKHKPSKNNSPPRFSTLSDLVELDDEDARKGRSSSVDSEECFSDEEAEALAQLITASRRQGRGQSVDVVLEEEVVVAPPPLPPKTTVTYIASEQERRDMSRVAELETRILEVQKELPALLDELRAAKRRAAKANRDLLESRDRAQRYRKAQSVVNRALKTARASMAAREFLAAILELTRAAEIERTNATVWYLLAQCRLAVRQLEEAEEACMTSVSLTPTAAGVALLGRILQERGRHDEAIECYLSALGREPLPA